MLAIWGLITIIGMILAIASRRVSPLIALFLFPVVASLASGFGLKTGAFAVAGLVSIAPVVAMFLFAILFFGVLTDPLALFRPLIPVQIIGLIYVFCVAIYLGRREQKRIGLTHAQQKSSIELSSSAPPVGRIRFAANLVLAAAVLGLVISGKVEPALCFMLGTTLALLLNFRTVREQGAVLDRHAKAAISMCAILCSAGVFTGILKGTGMLDAMAQASIAYIPAGFAPHIPFLLGLIAMPLSLLFDPDSFYFGILPVLAAAVQGFGLPATSVAEAALLGQMTTGFPVSPLTPATFLVTGLSEIELSAHQRFAGPFLFGASVVMTIAAVLLHIIPL